MIKIFEKFNEPEIKIEYHLNGNKWYEQWLLNGKEHREDGPSFQQWYNNGQKQDEYWSLNGRLHREDGYAHQHWYQNGQICFRSWYLKGLRYSRENWIEELKKIGSPHCEKQQMLLDMEKYNI